MSIEALPGVTPTFKNFVEYVRTFMRDFGELNRLVRGEESNDRQIAFAVVDALEDFNGSPPFTSLSLETLLHQYHQSSLLCRMSACVVVESVGLLQTRNQVNYSAGGTNLGVNDKTPLLMQWYKLFKNETEQKKMRAKVAMNIQNALMPAGVHSELFAVNATYAAF